jgi:hypothetical protein
MVAVDDTTAEPQVKADTEADVVLSVLLLFLQATRMQIAITKPVPDKRINFFMI